MFSHIDTILKLDVILLLFLIITAVSALWSRNLLVSTFLLAIFSLVMAAQYLVMGAPDVSMTEAAVGAGIGTLLLLLALFMVGTKEKRSRTKHTGALSVTLLTTAILLFIVFEMPAYGDKDSPAHTVLAPYFLNNTSHEIGIPNVVTAVLASYRGFDTLGETAVIFTASIAVLLLLGRPNRKKPDEERNS